MNFGTETSIKIYLGNKEVIAIYKGEDKVYENTSSSSTIE